MGVVVLVVVVKKWKKLTGNRKWVGDYYPSSFLWVILAALYSLAILEFPLSWFFCCFFFSLSSKDKQTEWPHYLLTQLNTIRKYSLAAGCKKSKSGNYDITTKNTITWKRIMENVRRKRIHAPKEKCINNNKKVTIFQVAAPREVFG